MGSVKLILVGIIGALLFATLYLLIVWLQLYLLGDSWFLHCLGPYSLLAIRIGLIGISLMPVIIDAAVLAVLVLTNLGSLSVLDKPLV
ncbi:hypothetical protein [Vulcanisaeta sp. JCM 16159]|uniref:hypothetical protein n=1 Tax=Vulcanisaeta sp. JCM 16159 TaxID=1295371 RepID=UPI0006D26B6D|nr:hypothetical protein [Vulcanisaeta sp. JCM 16159]